MGSIEHGTLGPSNRSPYGTINGIGLICDEHDCNIRVHNSFDILGSPSGNDFSIDGGSTVHTADELTEGAYFRDLVADTDTGEITGSGTVIARIHSA